MRLNLLQKDLAKDRLKDCAAEFIDFLLLLELIRMYCDSQSVSRPAELSDYEYTPGNLEDLRKKIAEQHRDECHFESNSTRFTNKKESDGLQINHEIACADHRKSSSPKVRITEALTQDDPGKQYWDKVRLEHKTKKWIEQTRMELYLKRTRMTETTITQSQVDQNNLAAKTPKAEIGHDLNEAKLLTNSKRSHLYSMLENASKNLLYSVSAEKLPKSPRLSSPSGSTTNFNSPLRQKHQSPQLGSASNCQKSVKDYYLTKDVTPAKQKIIMLQSVERSPTSKYESPKHAQTVSAVCHAGNSSRPGGEVIGRPGETGVSKLGFSEFAQLAAKMKHMPQKLSLSPLANTLSVVKHQSNVPHKAFSGTDREIRTPASAGHSKIKGGESQCISPLSFAKVRAGLALSRTSSVQGEEKASPRHGSYSFAHGANPSNDPIMALLTEGQQLRDKLSLQRNKPKNDAFLLESLKTRHLSNKLREQKASVNKSALVNLVKEYSSSHLLCSSALILVRNSRTLRFAPQKN